MSSAITITIAADPETCRDLDRLRDLVDEEFAAVSTARVG